MNHNSEDVRRFDRIERIAHEYVVTSCSEFEHMIPSNKSYRDAIQEILDEIKD